MNEPSSTTNRPSFDLVHEPWIPCVLPDGRSVELGLLETLVRAHEIRGVADASPLSTFALHRLLLAIVHSVLRGPKNHKEWQAIWQSGRFDERRFADYFGKWHERFDLFHPTHPFLQVGGYETVSGEKVATTSVTRLEPERASGNNATLFDHSIEEAAIAYAPAAAARALIVAQSWSLGGGKGPTGRIGGGKPFVHPYSSHAPMVGAVAVVVHHQHLHRTLTANLSLIGEERRQPSYTHASDLPTWERGQHRPPETATPTGYLEYLTWLARHVRLIPNDDRTVSTMCFAQGAILDETAGFESPFAFYRLDPKRGRVPIGLSEDKAIWRDSAALFALPRDGVVATVPVALRECRQGRQAQLVGSDGVLDVMCVGLANDKAKPLTWRLESIPASARLIDSEDAVALLAAAIEDIHLIAAAMQRAVRRLAQGCLEAEGRTPDTKDITRLQSRMLAKVGYWDAMERGFHRFIRILDDDARDQWRKEARAAARDGLGRAASFVQGGIARVGRALALAHETLGRELARLEAPQSATPSASAASQAEVSA